MERRRGQNNARNLFGINAIPSDEQTKNLLDPMKEQILGLPYWLIYHSLEQRGMLQAYHGVGGTKYVSLDGTQSHSSQKIHCKNCRVTIRDEKAYYGHLTLMAVLSAPEQKHVICLEPEFITPQACAEPVEVMGMTSRIVSRRRSNAGWKNMRTSLRRGA